MLYHFPDESEEDLQKKEQKYLEDEIEKAKRVEKHGYRRKEPSLPSFYTEWHCINNYLRCPIEKWSWPTSSKDKVELEPLPTDFLPSISLMKPLKFFDPESKEYIRRIVGFREIQQKREYIEYLKEIEAGMDDDDDDDNTNDSRVKEKLIRIDIEDDEEDGVDSMESEQEVEETQNTEDEPSRNEETFYKEEPFRRIARGGGKKDGADKDKKGGGDKDKKGGGDKDKKDTKGGGQKDGKGKDKDKSKKTDKDKKNKPGGKKAAQNEEEDGGFLGKIFHFFAGDEEQDTKGKGKGKKGKDDKGKGKKDDKKSKRKSKKDGDIETHGWTLSSFWKTGLDKQKQQMEKEHQQNLEQIFKYHGMFRVKAEKERDSEWLELSHTDPEKTENEIKTFGKPPQDWMKEGISYESQFLVRSMRIFTYATTFTMRSFMRVKTDVGKGHMDFTHRKRHQVLYFLSTIFFFTCVCMMTLSFVGIQLDNQANPESSFEQFKKCDGLDATKPITTECTQKQGETAKHEIEELMLNLYGIPFYVLVINLVLVSVWSVLVILGDGIFIAHYFNCWFAALAEMETSGSLGIQGLIVTCHVQFFIYGLVMGILFVLDYPKHVRQTNLLVAALIIRQFVPNIRIQPDSFGLLMYQVGGMAVQLYVMYCTMIVKLLMSILATILKNASEMWNFKFAVTFQQLATKNRGQLVRMGLNHSLLKLFTHHRILTVLLRNYGEVFAVPIMMYMVMEMGVMTLALVQWFFYKADDITKHYADDLRSTDIQIDTNISYPHQEEVIKIPYYHSREDVHMILYMMMIQLLFQFAQTTDILARAGDSFFAGYEFVRRSGTILSRNSHQRRLIQSLEWSFSSTNPSVLSANSYFTINRSTILSSFAAVAGFFSLIIQLQVRPEYPQIKFNTLGQCHTLGLELYRGTCIAKSAIKTDLSVDFSETDIKSVV